jgi:hypothetical protein
MLATDEVDHLLGKPVAGRAVFEVCEIAIERFAPIDEEFLASRDWHSAPPASDILDRQGGHGTRGSPKGRLSSVADDGVIYWAPADSATGRRCAQRRLFHRPVRSHRSRMAIRLVDTIKALGAKLPN